MSDKEQTATEAEQQLEEIVENLAENEASEEQPNEAQDQEVSLVEQIEQLQEDILKTKDDALRTLAEAQNIKRRAEKDVENARKFALEKFSGELLGVADNLERALDAADQADESVKALFDGVDLTHKSLIEILAKFNVTQINPLGEPFDPQLHQAISMVENPDVEPNTVTLVMQKGYTLSDRLLRPAMVMVAKAAANPIDEQA